MVARDRHRPPLGRRFQHRGAPGVADRETSRSTASGRYRDCPARTAGGHRDALYYRAGVLGAVSGRSCRISDRDASAFLATGSVGRRLAGTTRCSTAATGRLVEHLVDRWTARREAALSQFSADRPHFLDADRQYRSRASNRRPVTCGSTPPAFARGDRRGSPTPPRALDQPRNGGPGAAGGPWPTASSSDARTIRTTSGARPAWSCGGRHRYAGRQMNRRTRPPGMRPPDDANIRRGTQAIRAPSANILLSSSSVARVANYEAVGRH